MTYDLIFIAASLLVTAALLLACSVLALKLREAKRALVWRNIENRVLVQEVAAAIERARKAERVLEDWAKKDGKEPLMQPEKRKALS